MDKYIVNSSFDVCGKFTLRYDTGKHSLLLLWFSNHSTNFGASFVSICCRDILCISMKPEITVDELYADMREVCSFQEEQEFTMKWVDEEGRIL